MFDIYSSDYECISNSLLEALGLESLTRLTDCLARSIVSVENDVNGILVDAGDVDAFSTAMERLIDNRALVKNCLRKLKV